MRNWFVEHKSKFGVFYAIGIFFDVGIRSDVIIARIGAERRTLYPFEFLIESDSGVIFEFLSNVESFQSVVWPISLIYDLVQLG